MGERKRDRDDTTIGVRKEDKDIFDYLYMVHGKKIAGSKEEFFSHILKAYIKMNNIKSIRIEFDVEEEREKS
ncbi:hypothetical protein ACO3VM_09400 (plasmid) [Methanocaldococcus sp. 10A]